ENSTGKEDLQTLYWKATFKEKEVFQLNGGGEVFFRKQAIKEENIKRGYENKNWIIENKRFVNKQGKFLFHCPIVLNFKEKKYSKSVYAISEINDAINEKLLENDSVCFLGIDRGEKHLAYYSIVDKEGNILEQDTLNSIKGKDYNALLEKRSVEMDEARKSWQTIGTIKELKDGYISQVIRKIVDLSVQYNAFIVLEDLNVGFKQGRQKIEKSVYQKLELALAKKLNFLVDKSIPLGEVGSVTKALQLTPPVNTFGDMENRKQFGIMLYTRANYTSQTDPATGWRKTIYLKRGSEELIKKSILEAFSNIYFDGKDYVFSYTEKLGKDQKPGKEWKLYSGKNGISLDRFRGKRGKDFDEWNIEKIDIVKILDGLFEGFDKGSSLLDQIKKGKELNKVDDHKVYETLRFALDCIQQIRNSGKKEDTRDNDFLHSPMRNENGEHYDSRVYLDKERVGEKVSLPISGDANGAYNIARKGILMREHLRRDFTVYISDEEWSVWLSGKDAWEKWIQENEKNLKKKKK
ncbi:MAG: type V CRISPR-associated protein Cpf1, partial [Candidatus Moranbacteria bacterium]|nr:type V CRISPR-associated protein Cpf1 [Candidatus Moranbacteria bacterium]